MPTPTYNQIFRVASDVIKTLEDLDVEPCFIGSMASKLYGNARWPNDLDILCQNWTGTQEELKVALVSRNKSFYLVKSKDPNATYKVLWYRIAYRTSVKVDVLLPGALDLCTVPSNLIEDRNGLPCTHLSHLLLYKLQGWIHHGESLRNVDRLKQPADVMDIKALLRIAVHRDLTPLEEDYFDEEFIYQTMRRIILFVRAYPETKNQWRSLGCQTGV